MSRTYPPHPCQHVRVTSWQPGWADFPPALLEFWTERHLCTLTTLRADGSPHVVPVGVALDVEQRCAWVITYGSSRKAHHVAADGRVAACQVDGGRWSTIEGTAEVLQRRGPPSRGRWSGTPRATAPRSRTRSGWRSGSRWTDSWSPPPSCEDFSHARRRRPAHRPRPGDPRVRGGLGLPRRRQGRGHPRAVRPDAHRLPPAAQPADRPAGRRGARAPAGPPAAPEADRPPRGTQRPAVASG